MMVGQAEKQAFRVQMTALRALAHAQGQGDAAARLAEVLRGHSGEILAGYMPMRSEIDPLAAMAGHQGPVAVPVIPGPAQPLLFRRWTPEAVMIPGAFGALIPESGEDLTPEVLIVPLLAFDLQGYRMGYGGGFYDRTLEALRAGGGKVTAIGFAYEAQRVAAVPRDATDQPLDLIVTEAGVYRP